MQARSVDLPRGSNAERASFLTLGGTLGVGAIVPGDLATGVQGWSLPWLEAAFGELPDRQFGADLGGSVAFLDFQAAFVTVSSTMLRPIASTER